eukprot:gene8969-biopygen1848
MAKHLCFFLQLRKNQGQQNGHFPNAFPGVRSASNICAYRRHPVIVDGEFEVKFVHTLRAHQRRKFVHTLRAHHLTERGAGIRERGRGRRQLGVTHTVLHLR